MRTVWEPRSVRFTGTLWLVDSTNRPALALVTVAGLRALLYCTSITGFSTTPLAAPGMVPVTTGGVAVRLGATVNDPL